MRIVSLLSGATELVCALGAGAQLVGRSHECDWPDRVKALPSCTSPTFDVHGSSRRIDQLVRALLSEGKPLYRIDGDLLGRLAPDVIITQAHCEVCAPGPEDLRRDACSQDIGAHTVELTASTLEEMFAAFARIAEAIDRVAEGRRLLDERRSRLNEIGHRIGGRPRPSVVCLEWIDPIFPMGNWGPELVDMGGGDCRLGSPGRHSAAVSWELLRRADPQFLIVAPCGFGLERTAQEMPALTGLAGWNDLRAVREGNVFIADGNRYFNRSGPSVVNSVEILAEILHSDIFPPLRRGPAWQAYLPRPRPACTSPNTLLKSTLVRG